MDCCELERYAARWKPSFRGVIASDYRGSLKNGTYLGNTTTSDGHWVAFIVHGTTIIYFDSYGVEPLELRHMFGTRTVWYSTRRLQGGDSLVCGLYVLCFLWSWYNHWLIEFLAAFPTTTTDGDNPAINDAFVQCLFANMFYP